MKQLKQRRDKIARLISWGHWFTFFNILLVLAIGTLYIEATEAPGSALGVLYLIINWLGHFAFLPFVFFIILIFPFCLVLPYTRVLRGIGTLVASFGLIALVADALFYRQYGYHLNTYSLSQLAMDAETVFAGASFVILIGLLLVFVVLLIFELGLANIAWKRLDRLQAKYWGPSLSAVFVACFLGSHSLHIWADAVFYTPITKQDDMFPLSYPTTAKTLMSKHGLLEEQRQEATENLIRHGTDIHLTYPARELQCARVPQAPNTLIVGLAQFDDQTARAVQQEFATLTAYQQPILGHRNLESALFELLYALPDLYLPAIANAQLPPVYIEALRDYQIDVILTQQLPTERLPAALTDFDTQQRSNPSATIEIITTGQWSPELQQLIQQQLERGNQIFVVGLTPHQAKGEQGYAQQAMQVNLLYSEYIPLQAHPLALLTDIMPTVLASYLNCVDDAKAYSIGVDLTSKPRRLPVMTSYGDDLVVYDQQITSVIHADAVIHSFDTTSLTPLPGVTPATPVLVDGIRKLKRFSQEREINPVDE